MFSFTLFDVGHGFCAYTITPGGSDILFDCGYDADLPFYPSRYFYSRGNKRIHNLVLSHFDQDHVANLSSLKEVVSFDSFTRNRSVPVDFIRREKAQIGLVSTSMTNAIDMHADWIHGLAIGLNYGGVKVTYFYNPYSTFTDMNNLSLVTFLEYQGTGIVIPGDLEREGWKELMKGQAFCQCLRETTFFVASHHGRYAGYCEEVFDYCNPYIILLSDKSIVHDSQEHDYTKHAIGIDFPNGQTRRVLTTRNDGHISIEKQSGQAPLVTINLSL